VRTRVFLSGVNGKTGTELRDIIMQDRRKEPQSYAAPKFAIRTPDNKFILSIGGQVNPILGYDLGNDLYDADGGGNDRQQPTA